MSIQKDTALDLLILKLKDSLVIQKLGIKKHTSQSNEPQLARIFKKNTVSSWHAFMEVWQWTSSCYSAFDPKWKVYLGSNFHVLWSLIKSNTAYYDVEYIKDNNPWGQKLSQFLTSRARFWHCTVDSLYKHACGTRIRLPCLFWMSCKINKRSYNKADLHRKQCYGTQTLGA